MSNISRVERNRKNDINSTSFLFDLDETLVQSQAAKFAAIKETLGECQISSNSNQLMNKLNNTTDPLKLLLQELRLINSPYSKTDLRKSYWNNLRKVIPRLVKSFNDIPDLLSFLRENGFKIGIVTSLPSIYANMEIETARLGKFGCKICYHDTTRKKPHPEPIIAALRRLNSNSNETIYIGDQQTDIQAGKAAKVNTAWALWGVPKKKWSLIKKVNPDYVFETPKAIIASLKKDSLYS